MARTAEIITPLGEWLRNSSPEMKQELERRSGISIGYLYLLAGVHRENPKIRTVLALVESANAIRQEQNAVYVLPELTPQDFALPSRR